MKYPVNPGERRPYRIEVADIRLNETEARVPFKAAEIAESAAGEVIQSDHLMPLRQQQLAEVAADKTSTSCYQCLHESAFPDTDASVLYEVNMRHGFRAQAKQIAVHLVHAAVLAAFMDIQLIAHVVEILAPPFPLPDILE